MTPAQAAWRFPGTFWIANLTELFEQAAYYGTFIAIRTYLIRVVLMLGYITWTRRIKPQ